MQLQVIVSLVLQIYQSQHVLYALFLTYCVQDLVSKNNVQFKNQDNNNKPMTIVYIKLVKMTCLLWCTFADPMHFAFTVNISQCCSLISGIERKEVHFLNTSSCLLECGKNEINCKTISNKPHKKQFLRQVTSFGSASIPTIAQSMASWFSVREARAAIRTTESGSTPLAKT